MSASADKVNLAQKLASFDEVFAPKIVGELNDYKGELVKARGEFVWHKHDDTDDFFLVLDGRLTIQLRDRDVVLSKGEMFIVPRGVEHCPRAEPEAQRPSRPTPDARVWAPNGHPARKSPPRTAASRPAETPSEAL